MSEKDKPIGQCKHNINMTVCGECSPLKKVNFWDRIAPFTHDQCQHLYEQAQSEIAELRRKLDLAVESLEKIGCNETYHRLGGIDDCERCKALAKIKTEGDE